MKNFLYTLKYFFAFHLVLFPFLGLGQTANTVSLTFNASSTWTVPCGVTSVTVQSWGAGGGGGGDATNGGNSGSGGGGGGYSTGVIAVVPGTNIAFTVGVGGAGGNGDNNGAVGGSSTFGTITAPGGAGGAFNSGAGGAGGIGNSGSGGVGGVGGAVGGTGGQGANSGGTGGTGSSGNDGTAGSSPGGGGGGGDDEGGSTRAGGAGGNGRIIITYTSPIASAGADVSVECAQTPSLSANAPFAGFTGAWTVISGTATVNSPSSPTSSVTVGVGNCATLRWTMSGGSCATTTDDVIVCKKTCNDEPCGALPISAFNTCSYTEVSNVGSTQTSSSIVAVPTCGGIGFMDTWYTVTVPSNGQITFQSSAGTITDGAMAVYTSTGGCNGPFTQIACNDDCGGAFGLMPCVSINNASLAGQTLYVRIWDYYNPNPPMSNGYDYGTFNVCAIGNVGSCTPTTADCLGAIPVCSNTSYSNLASGQGCTADLNSGNDGCLAGEHNMTYYVIRIGSSGTWGFEGSFPVTSNGIEYDWALWQLSGNPLTTSSACSLSAPIRCSYASQAGKSEVAMGMVSSQPEYEEDSSPSGDGYVHWLDAATAGQYYLLGIDRWSTAGGAYTINFTGSATMSCDIMTVLPVVLVNFDGKPLERENKIYWTTASQTNNDYFTVEKSKNGISWEVMSTVQGMGTTADVIEYSVLDYDPFSLTYYRLKQTDYDGTVKTFDPIVVSRNSDESELFSELYPNPTTGDLYFNYTGSNFTEPIEVTLYSTTGGRMTKHGYVSFNNYQGLNIDCKDLSNGVYSVTLRQGSKIEHKKFTIIR
ncbi:MAG: hypothetical protein RIT43_1252 [Bacteroidota bacterium]